MTSVNADHHDLYKIAIDGLSDGIYMVDKEKQILIWNTAAEKITGYLKEDMQKYSFSSDILDYMDHAGSPVTKQRCPIEGTMRDGRATSRELYIRHKRGYRVPILLKTSPIRVHDEIVGAIAVFSDNSVRVQEDNLASSLARLVMTDQLTGLSNKHHTETVLESKLDDFKRNGKKLSVLFINLDDFAQCNHDYGYEAGNQMLITLAHNFKKSFRSTDFVGRWSGDEFIGVFETKSPDHLKILTEKIRILIESTEIRCMGDTIHVTASIGATMVCMGDHARQLIDRAASLMHVSKISGKNCVTIG